MLRLIPRPAARHLAIATAAAALAALGAVSGPCPASAAEGRLLRFPNVSRDRVTFVYANDIWVAPRAGGVASKITSHEGQEWFPRFSPDGQWIAFTGDYDGNREVYVVPAAGGEPTRLTYSPDIGASVAERMGPDNAVLGWTPDGRIIFRSRRDQWNAFMGRPWAVSPAGGLPEPLPMPYGGLTSFSPNGSKVAYNPTWREFRTWKRYRGGMAQDIWIFDLASHEAERITDWEGIDDFPMWHGDTIYYLSDQGGRANLYAYDTRAKRAQRLTDVADFDIKWPSLGPDAIAYEHGGRIHTYDLATGSVSEIRIEVPSDKILVRPHFVPLGKSIDEFSLSPDGKRALFVARGEAITVPAKDGEPRNLTQTSGARERWAAWSPDGKRVAYVSDASGEEEIYVRSQDGKGEATRITTDGSRARFALVWSPDSKKILVADKSLRLYWVDVDARRTTLIDTAATWEIRDYAWSPDSRWVAYAKPSEGLFYSIYLYNIGTRDITKVTTDFTQDYSPTFDPDGKYLFFLSDRDWNATPAGYESNFVYSRRSRPYAVTLRADLHSPFEPKSDEAGKGGDGEKEEGGSGGEKGDGKGAKKEKKVEPTKIDLAGIGGRVVGFPVDPGEYAGLRAVSGKVLWLSSAPGTLTGDPPGKTSLRIYDLEEREEKEVLKPVDAYDVAADGKKIIVQSDDKYYILDAKPEQKAEKALKVSGLEMLLDPRAEWRQILDEAWRLERDYFYAPNMHGVDWAGLHGRYAALLPYVAHRVDLTYLLGEMLGELGVGHSYVGGGEGPEPERVKIGLLGADLEADRASGRYRITRIFEGQNWDDHRRSPLTEPGLNVKVGDYILSIDGKPLAAPTDPGSLLWNRAGKQTTLVVNGRPTEAGSREIVVVPIDFDSGLRYWNSVEANRRYVEKATGGRVGYIHIPNMGGDGLNEFAKTYYPQVRKEGLVIDVRWNGGGFVSEMIIERLRRVLGSMAASRNGADFTYPDAVHIGPKVCLLNQWSASDGDYFPYHFRGYKLGPIVGKRSWGGVVGIRGGPNLVDGGFVTIPEFGAYGLDGKWIIENHGVDPDIEVENLPKDVIAGKDAQLDRAIALIMDELAKKSYTLPKRPADPTDR
jgi:tricorn protease